jgi:hypothetical protein
MISGTTKVYHFYHCPWFVAASCSSHLSCPNSPMKSCSEQNAVAFGSFSSDQKEKTHHCSLGLFAFQNWAIWPGNPWSFRFLSCLIKSASSTSFGLDLGSCAKLACFDLSRSRFYSFRGTLLFVVLVAFRCFTSSESWEC